MQTNDDSTARNGRVNFGPNLNHSQAEHRTPHKSLVSVISQKVPLDNVENCSDASIVQVQDTVDFR
jgi:hypothetical protein